MGIKFIGCLVLVSKVLNLIYDLREKDMRIFYD